MPRLSHFVACAHVWTNTRGQATACAFVLSLLCLLPGQSAAAPIQSPSEPVPRVSLADVKATPGSSVMMPFTLAADPSQPLRSLTAEIEFVSKSMTFEKVTPGLAAELVHASVQASIVKEQMDANGLNHVTLRINAAVPESADARLPDGLLAYLFFRVSQEAQSFTVRLSPTAASGQLQTSPPKPIANIASKPGSVVIESKDALYDRIAPPVACFFFSH